MSRVYRISVSESLQTRIKAGDRIRQSLDLLPVLSPDETAQILGARLAEKGFKIEGDLARHVDGDLIVEINLKDGTLEAHVSTSQNLDWTKQKSINVETRSADAENKLKQKLAAELQAEAKSKEAILQEEVTRKLTAKLLELQDDIDLALNETTKEALKIKAGRIGHIEEIQDDGAGAVTITVRV